MRQIRSMQGSSHSFENFCFYSAEFSNEFDGCFVNGEERSSAMVCGIKHLLGCQEKSSKVICFDDVVRNEGLVPVAELGCSSFFEDYNRHGRR
jgi:hypothetical protein